MGGRGFSHRPKFWAFMKAMLSRAAILMKFAEGRVAWEKIIRE